MTDQPSETTPAAAREASAGAPADTGAEPGSQPLCERVDNRTHSPESSAFAEFMASQWAPAAEKDLPREEVADHAAQRRLRISKEHTGQRLVIPAGAPKVRSNEVSLGTNVDDGKIVFGVAQYVFLGRPWGRTDVERTLTATASTPLSTIPLPM